MAIAPIVTFAPLGSNFPNKNIPAPNKVNDNPTSVTQSIFGYLSYTPFPNILLEIFIAKDMIRIEANPCAIISPLGSNLPRANIPPPKRINDNPTSVIHFIDGYLVYIPSCKIQLVKTIAVDVINTF